ncbi:MAG: hypothetical protein ACKO26_22035 [Planctomycetota bacterium]
MSTGALPTLKSATRDYPALAKVLGSISAGDTIRIHKKLRINSMHSWNHEIVVNFSHFDFLSTGLATDRVPEDDVVLVCIHFCKQNGELGSVILDDQTTLEKM